MNIEIFLASSALGAVAGAITNFLMNKRLDRHQRMMEMRKVEYVKISQQLSGFYDTTTPEERKEYLEELPAQYRNLLAWGSDDVLRKLMAFIKAINVNSSSDQLTKDRLYKELIIAMRIDLLGKTKLSPSEIEILGEIK